MGISGEFTIEVLPLEILSFILSFIPGIGQIGKLVSKNMAQAVSMVKDDKIRCGEYAAETGSLKLVQWLMTQGCRDNFCLGAVRGGHLEIVQYLVEKDKFKFTHNIYNAAIEYGRVDILNFFVEQDLFNEAVLLYKKKISRVKDLKTLEWIFEHFTCNSFMHDLRNACVEFAREGNNDVIKKIVDVGKEIDSLDFIDLGCRLVKGAIEGKNDWVMKYLLENGLKLKDLKDDALKSAIKNHNLEFYEKWFGEVNDVEQSFVFDAAKCGCPKEILEKLIVNSDFNAQKLTRLWVKAIKGGHVHVVEFLEEKFGKLREFLKKEHWDFHPPLWRLRYIAIQSGKVDMMNWIFSNNCLNSYINILKLNVELFIHNIVSLEWIIKKVIDRYCDKTKDRTEIIDYLANLFEKRQAYHQHIYNVPSGHKEEEAISVSITKYCLSKYTQEILHILMKKEFPLDPKIIYQFAIKENDYKLLLWVLTHYKGISKNDKLELCALSGDLGGVIKCIDEGDLFEEKIVGWAAKMGHRKVVHWLTVNALIPKFMN
jgi:hypothetical protein